MRKRQPTPAFVAPSWPARLQRVTWPLLATVLTGCSATMAVTPRIPPPAPELMEPTPTGSEVLQRATQSMESWHQMLLSGPTE